MKWLSKNKQLLVWFLAMIHISHQDSEIHLGTFEPSNETYRLNYTLFKNDADFNEASSNCKANLGSLLNLDSEEKYNFFQTAPALDCSNSPGIWISLVRRDATSDYEWIDGNNTSAWSNWNDSHPQVGNSFAFMHCDDLKWISEDFSGFYCLDDLSVPATIPKWYICEVQDNLGPTAEMPTTDNPTATDNPTSGMTITDNAIASTPQTVTVIQVKVPDYQFEILTPYDSVQNLEAADIFLGTFHPSNETYRLNYTLFKNDADFNEASSKCKEILGSLLKMDSEEKYNFFQTELASSCSNSQDIWLSLVRQNGNSDYEWICGSNNTSTWSNWNDSHPQVENSFAYMQCDDLKWVSTNFSGFYWLDDLFVPATTPKWYICEVQVANGNWSDWGAYRACDTACGGGIVTRTRTCDNPAPTNGGLPCPGNDTETAACNTHTCIETSTEQPTTTDNPTITDDPTATDNPTITDNPSITDGSTATDNPNTTDNPITTDNSTEWATQQSSSNELSICRFMIVTIQLLLLLGWPIKQMRRVL